MANHRIYQYTSIGRSLDLTRPGNKAVAVLMAIAAVLGAAIAWVESGPGFSVVQQALYFLLILFASWALARELDPDDALAAFISMAAAMLAAVLVDFPGILIVYTTLFLVRIVNRSSGLVARKTDSFMVMALSIGVIYTFQSPLFGVVAALAFMLDGSLREPLRHQWVFGLICLGATVVYMVDHEFGLTQFSVPDTLFEWFSLLLLLIFALDTLLLKKVRSKGDVNARLLDVGRVRGGMAVGFLAALTGIGQSQVVVIVVATIAGLVVGMAIRKGFKAPVKESQAKDGK